MEMENEMSLEIEPMQEALSSLMQRLELDKLTCQGLRIVHFQKGFIRFHFIVPHNTSEEVEIEAKIIGNKGKLTSVEVKVKKKDDKQLIAIGKIWTAPIGTRAPWNNRPSKL